MEETATAPLSEADVGTKAIGRRFWIIISAICLAGLVIRLLILSQYVEKSPFAIAPRVDAEVYWNWAERISQGQIQLDTPFFSAPLYPFLLGALRALGGTLTTVYVIQILADLLTACLLARLAARRFGSSVGYVSAALFLIMLEPASASLRVLPGSLQLLLVTITWGQLVSLQERPTGLRRVTSGVSAGLLCLAYPPAMLLVIALWPWTFLQSTRKGRDALLAVVPVAAAVLTIAPATIHNWRACGEFIPISAHAGITLYQGNAPGASGGYTVVPGISNTKERMHHDAARVFEQETGRRGTWKEIDSHYLAKALKRWKDEPYFMCRLTLRKARWFFTGRIYGDQYNPVLERLAGFGNRMYLTPIITAWVLGPAIVGIVFVLRRPIRLGPELALFFIPVIVALAFWYSPRYRLPVIPVATVLASLAIVKSAIPRYRRDWIGPTVVCLAMAMLVGPSNRRSGFDTVDEMAPEFFTNAGWLLEQDGQLDEAGEYYDYALFYDSRFTEALLRSAKLAIDQGDADKAIERSRTAVEIDPNNALANRSLGTALLNRNDREAAIYLQRAVSLDPTLHGTRAMLEKLLHRLEQHRASDADLPHTAEENGMLNP